MSDWRQVRCGDIFKVKHGFAFKGAHFSDASGAIVLTPGNFEAGGGLKLRPGKDRSYTADFPPEFRLRANDLLVVMTDLTQEAAILGAPAIVPDNLQCLHNQRLGKIVNVDEDQADWRFLYYVFNTREYREHLRATATGSTVKHTSPSRIYEHKICLPPLPIQRRISSILGAYDDLIEINRRRIAVLEEMARGLFEEWFVFFRFPSHELVPIIDTPAGLLPEGWIIQTVGDTFNLLGGGTPSKAEPEYWTEGTIDWFTPSDLTKSKTLFMESSGDRITSSGLAKSSAKLFPADSIMMTSRATIGEISICTGPACTNQGFITCLPNEVVPRSYLYYWLLQNVPLFIAHATGATFKEITKGVFKRLPITVPPREISAQFDEQVRPIHDMILALERSNGRLAASRDLILPRLISGQLSVTEAERKLKEVA